MALAVKNTGDQILATDVDQYHDLLTGTMTDQPVKLGNTFEAVGAATLDSTLKVTGATTLTGGVTGAMAATGAVSGTTGTFTGAVQSNSHPVVEGTTGQAAPNLNVTHAEAFHDVNTNVLAAGATVSKTLTFSRGFAAKPAISASAMTTAADVTNVAWGVGALSLTAVTVVFKNTDAASQTLSDFSITAMGA